jgi:hypothetical protein
MRVLRLWDERGMKRKSKDRDADSRMTLGTDFLAASSWIKCSSLSGHQAKAIPNPTGNDAPLTKINVALGLSQKGPARMRL